MSASPHHLPVSAEAAGQRLDLFVGEKLGLARAKLKALFEADGVRVDGRKAKKGQRVEAGQLVAVTLEPEAPRSAAPTPDAPLTVLREDTALVFVDKASGTPSHPLAPGEEGTVANALVARYPECATASVDPREGGLCHRLDIETSGVLLAARTREAWESMRNAFSRQEVDKRYWALVTGPIGDDGEIDLPLRHHPRHPDRVQPAVEGGEDAREARSTFRVLQRAGASSLVEVQIHTGVLHQVRAHLAAIGAPLVGDKLYGGEAAPALGRFFLHARTLSVRHPVDGTKVEVTAPLPPELEGELGRRGMR